MNVKTEYPTPITASEKLPSFAWPLLLLYSWWASELHSFVWTYPDALFYKTALELFAQQNIQDAYITYGLILSASEPLSFLIFYAASKIISIESLNIVLNATLLYTVFGNARKHRLLNIFVILLIVTNYYLLILSYETLRLKIALTLVLAATTSSSLKTRRLLLIAAPFAHLQILLLYIAKLLPEAPTIVLRKPLISILVLALIPFLLQNSNIAGKIDYYQAWDQHIPFRMMALMLIGLVIVGLDTAFILLSLTFLGAALIVGEGRLNCIYIGIILFSYMEQEKRQLLSTLLISAALIYLSIKGINFTHLSISKIPFLIDCKTLR